MTLVVNLVAGPGAGKSTTAAGVFANLKMDGHNVELAHEWIKEAVWEGRTAPAEFQPYVFGKQAFRMHKLLKAGLDAIITDSPIFFSVIYGENNLPCFNECVMEQFRQYDSLNIFLKRNPKRKYNPAGRRQTEAQAKLVDKRLKRFMDTEEILFTEVVTGHNSTALIADMVREAACL